MAGLAFASEDQNKFSSRFENISEQYARDRILEFWGYHDSQGSELYKNTIRLRYYQPLNINRFNGTLRLDTSYVREYGAGIPTTLLIAIAKAIRCSRSGEITPTSYQDGALI
jgi:hypothetical protein